ncbi:MAG: FAD:protein FMN transferase [Propionicimonas sp.]|nr:FAD:protein FMN transferase [Propionicimonas sp.]
MLSAALEPEQVATRCALAVMGTIVTIRAAGGDAETGARLAMAEVERLERLWSRFRPDSDVSRLAAADGEWLRPAPETAALLAFALRCRLETGGSFDVTAGSPSGGRLEADRNGRFRMVGGARVDLGGIGKGAAAARVVAVLAEYGATSAVVNFGQSSIGLLGTPAGQDAWQVGIRRPAASSDQIVGALRVQRGFVSTSGDYEQRSARANHILDPWTGLPADSGVRSATVVCDDGARAEALSTALIVLGVDAGLALHARLGGFDAVLVTAGGEIVTTPGLA